MQLVKLRVVAMKQIYQTYLHQKNPLEQVI